MPNWVDNYIRIKGSPAEILAIKEAKLDFEILHPCPFVVDGEYMGHWYEWCCSHWGTKWPASDLDMTYEDTEIAGNFRTAWSPPHGFLAFLTKKFPTCEITNEYSEELERAGYSEYKEGLITDKYIILSECKPSAVEKFVKDVNPEWFDYDSYISNLESMDLELEEYSSTVRVYENILSYEEFVDNMTNDVSCIT